MSALSPGIPPTPGNRIAAMTPSESSRLGVMRGAKPLVPKTFNVLTKPKPAPKQTNPYDSFNLVDPYAPGQITKTATSGYNTDVANANKLAAMGYLTQAQRDAQAGNQATQAQGIGAALAAQIAGIQQATVAQGNASGAALGAQNTATGSSGAGVAGLAGVAAPAGVSAPAVNAVLGTQNAATGNLYGGLQSAALASGAQNAKQAYANEAVNVQNDQQSQQKTLAQLLSGVSPVSAREATMASANSSVDAANKATELSLYQSGVTQQENEDALGEKKQAAAQGLANKKLLAGMSNTEKTKLGLINAKTKVATTQSNNAAKVKTATINQQGAASRSAASIAAANRRANAGNQTRLTVADIDAGKKIHGAKTYAVTVKYPATTELVQGKVTVIPAKTKAITVNEAQWGAYVASGPKGKRQLNRLGLPNGAKVIYAVKKS